MEPWVVRGSSQSSRGFTLVELLLVLVLMFLLLGAVIFSFSTAQTNAQLTEGASQFEALLHFARAQAAFAGKRVELRLVAPVSAEGAPESPAGLPVRRLEVRWEPDPVQQPGVFHSMVEAKTFLVPMQDLVEITEIRPLSGSLPEAEGGEGTSLVSTNGPGRLGEGGEESDSESDSLTVTLFPDGSSDSGEFGLRVPFSEDGRMIWISLDGITGAIRRRMEIPEDVNRDGDRDAEKETSPRPEGVAKAAKK
ncbi:MAG: prepilin-type N-terminal cleavage/methylation domain-containing protein [Verrucomicrobiales bacterium]|nr:prepilin-type N-terminal cleavage/methylation domain-containing protein [Verrucomicrobiales bacterium]